MKYSDLSFRDVYKKHVVLPIENHRDSVKGFPSWKESNCILTYGYVDHQVGLTLEVLACGLTQEDGSYVFFETSDETRTIIRIGSIENEELYVIDYPIDLYNEKIAKLSVYEEDEGILASREMELLDESRNEFFPDDVLVYLTKKGLNPEGCWVRIEGLQSNSLIGTLLNEPDQDFGYHQGETIGFFIQKTEDDHIICVSDMNPDIELKKEDLKDGTLLRKTIKIFNNERNNDNFINVLELLRDSDIWIPCSAILSEEDQKKWEEIIKKHTDSSESIAGLKLTNSEQIRMAPDILQNDGNYYFPVFSSIEEMGEYGKGFSKIEDSFVHAITLAKNNDKKVKGIVIDAFTEPFVLDAEIFDIVKNAKSRLIEDKDE